MFELFNDRARRVVVMAQEEARLQNHDLIDTEHILLGLIYEEEGVAANALKTLGISAAGVREYVDARVARGVSAPTGSLSFAALTRNVFELSMQEAQELHDDFIGTEHLLIGLAREGQGMAAAVLSSFGADLSRVRGTVAAIRSATAGVPPGSPRAESAATPSPIAGDERVTHRADQTWVRTDPPGFQNPVIIEATCTVTTTGVLIAGEWNSRMPSLDRPWPEPHLSISLSGLMSMDVRVNEIWLVESAEGATHTVAVCCRSMQEAAELAAAIGAPRRTSPAAQLYGTPVRPTEEGSRRSELERGVRMARLAQAEIAKNQAARAAKAAAAGRRTRRTPRELETTSFSVALLLALAREELKDGDYGPAKSHAQEAIGLAPDNRRAQAESNLILGVIASAGSDDDTPGLAQVLEGLLWLTQRGRGSTVGGTGAGTDGEPPSLDDMLIQLMKVLPHTSDTTAPAGVKVLLAIAAFRDGRIDESRHLLQETLVELRALNQPTATVLLLLSVLTSRLGVGGVAEDLAAEGVQEIDRERNAWLRAGNLELAAEALAESDPKAALQYAVASVGAFESLRHRFGTQGDRVEVYRGREQTYLRALRRAHGQADGRAALLVAETSRQDAVSSLLAIGLTNLSLPPEASDVLRRIAALESVLATEWSESEEGDADARAPSRPTFAARLGTEEGSARAALAAAHAERDRLSALLAEVTSKFFRQAFDPDPVDVDSLRQALGTHHGLVYQLEEMDGDRLGCFAIWIPPNGDIVVDRTEIHGAPLRLLLGYYDKDIARGAGVREPAAYEALTLLLLPEGLRDVLLDKGSPPPSIMAVPSGLLWSFPFAALRLGGQPLVHRASITLAPSLAMFEAVNRSSRRAHPRGPQSVMASYYPGLPGQDVELAALRRSYGDAHVRRVDPQDLRSELARASEHDVLVVGVHGDDGVGLAQALLLGDGRRLHAGELLAFGSPRIVVVAACWAARLAYAAGAEPLGLATVVLASGARCFVGGLFEIGSSATGEILAGFYERLRAGDGPAEALRKSQVRYLESFEREPAPFQWAGLVPVGSGG